MKKLRVTLAISVLMIGGSAFAEDIKDKGESLKWQNKLSIEERLRYEYKNDFDLNQSKKDNGGQFYHRLRLGVETGLKNEHLDPLMEIFVEGIDVQTGGYQMKAASNQVDDFDLHQLYVNVHKVLGTNVDLKAGRQELKYGKGRLIGAPAWSNRIRAFDAGVLHYEHLGFYADAIYGQDVKYDDDKFNQSRNEEILSGAYAGYQKDKASPLFESYILSLVDIKGSNDIHRYTTGLRFMSNIGKGTVLDVEIPYQFGQTGTTTAGVTDIRAYAFHIDISKSMDQLKWKPKLAVAYDEASGDRDPNDSVNNSFVPLYQSTHENYGLLDFFRWQNMRNPEISLTVSPTSKLKITPQADFFWLESKFDNWYNSSGSNVRTKTSGDRGSFVGSEVSLRGIYDWNKHFKLESGYAHFFPGEYVKDSGSDDDIDWVYVQMNLKY